MSRIAITPQTLPLVSEGGVYYPTTPLSVTTANLVETAANASDFNVAAITDGKTIVLAHNTDSGAHTITIASVVDTYNRKGDITAYSIGPGLIACFGPFKLFGWNQSGLNIDCSSALIKLAVINLP